jgi:alanine racemase
MIPQHATLYLSRGRLANNLAVLRGLAGRECEISVVVKADAYGHGAKQLVPELVALGIQTVCVYTRAEAEALVGLIPRIIVLAPLVFDPGTSVDFVPPHPSITLTLQDHQTLAALINHLSPTQKLSVQVQIDTGLTRCGIEPNEAPALIEKILQTPAFVLHGLFAHLSHGEVPHHPTLAAQSAALTNIADPFRSRVPGLKLHLQNSGGTRNLPPGNFNMVRIGIAAYGLQPDASNPIPGVQPIARITAPILAIHHRPPGTGVGYNHLFSTSHASRLAILPIGYADGYPRAMTHVGVVAINNHLCPIVGRVSMDQLIVDVTSTHATLGDSATVISDQPDAPNSVESIARHCNTISYEITTGFGSRLARQWID